MAGSTGSGQDIESGRVNRAEGRTAFWAQVPPGQSNFNGPAIVIVDVAEGPLDDADYEAGESFLPSNSVHGLIAVGSSGSASASANDMPAHGLIGRGGLRQGTGVLGMGGGSDSGSAEHGDGGIGVHGVGGSRLGNSVGAITPPGAGVLGQGGRQPDNDNRLRLQHAPGVVGLGGSRDGNIDTLPAHSLEETAGAGVYGKGADAVTTLVVPLDADGNSTSGPQVPSGPLCPGPGVLGRGGSQDGNAFASAAGVIGLAGLSPLPKPSEMVGTGVYGAGTIVGVLGSGSIGLLGRGIGGRAAVLETGKHPQLQLIPLRMPSPAELADRCDAGDLLVTKALDNERQTEIATLWFCKVGGPPDQAQWVAVG